MQSCSFLRVKAGHRCTLCKDMFLLQGGPPPSSVTQTLTLLIALIYRLCYNIKLHKLTCQWESNVVCIDSGEFYSLAV